MLFFPLVETLREGNAGRSVLAPTFGGGKEESPTSEPISHRGSVQLKPTCERDFFGFPRKFLYLDANYWETAVSDQGGTKRMRTMFNCTRKPTATLPPRRTAKRVVLAGRFKLGAKVADQFRKLGWEVHTVTTEHDVHAAAAETNPHAILLPEVAGDESGYLACAKLLITQPKLKVVVVGTERTLKQEQFADFVGASFVTEDDGVNEVVNAVV